MKKTFSFFKSHTVLFSAVLLTALLFTIIGAISIGAVHIRFNDVWRVIIYRLSGIGDMETIAESTQDIVWYLRLPRVLLTGMVGSLLTMSGIAMQAFTKNPLADPYILGVSSGASFGAVASIILGAFSFAGAFNTAIGAFFGAIASITLVYILSKSGRNVSPIRLVLIGVAVSSMFGAFTNYIVYMAPDDAKIREATFWMLGGFAGVKWAYLIPAVIVLIPTVFVMFCLSNAMNAMMMGEETAISLGINVSLARKLLIIATALMAAVSVSVSGTIGFVGLVIPHIVRAITGADHKKMLPISILFGAIFLIWVDVGARMLDAPGEIPIGIITSMTGAPFFLWLVKYKKYSFGSKA